MEVPKTVSALQKFLKDRDVPCANERKAALEDLVIACQSLNLPVDPDGLLEDRSEVMLEKLRFEGGELPNPTCLIPTPDISCLPKIELYDISPRPTGTCRQASSHYELWELNAG